MLKRLSKTGFLLQFIIFLAIGTILWFPAFVHPPLPVNAKLSGALYLLISGRMSGNSIVAVSLAASFIVVQAFLLHILLSSNDLIPRDSFIDGIIYLVCMSWHPSLLCFHPAIPAGIFIIVALYMLMKMYGQSEPYQYVFTAAFSVAIASLIYLPAIYFMIGLWISLLTFRIASWREWFITIIGLMVPFLYVISYYYWIGALQEGWLQMVAALRFQKGEGYDMTVTEIVFLVTAILMMAITMITTLNAIQDKLISIRRKTWVIIDFTIAGLIGVILTFGSWKTGHFFLMMPLAFFLTYAVIAIKKSRMNDLLVLLFVVMAIVIHYIV
jgi:hypothetical protein